MPQIGEIRQTRELGLSGGAGYGKRVWAKCPACGKERWVKHKSLRRWLLRHPDSEYQGLCQPCSARIVGKASLGKRIKHGIIHGNYKGYSNTATGYKLIKLEPDNIFYPMAHSNGFISEHRLIVAQHLGRCLETSEIVHHKGVKYPLGSIENKQDNRYPENLELIQTVENHQSISILVTQINRLKTKIERLECSNQTLKKRLSLHLMSELSNW